MSFAFKIVVCQSFFFGEFKFGNRTLVTFGKYIVGKALIGIVYRIIFINKTEVYLFIILRRNDDLARISRMKRKIKLYNKFVCSSVNLKPLVKLFFCFGHA